MLTNLNNLHVYKTQYIYLSQKLNFQHILLENFLIKKFRKQSYYYIKFLINCLKKEVDVLMNLMINLLESKIK